MDDLEYVAKIKEMRADEKNGKHRMREFLKLPGHLDRLFDLAIKAGSKKPPKHKSRSGLPDGFPDQPQKDRAKGFWAQKHRQDLVATVEDQAAHFRDYHLGAGTLAADWPATWGTWMRNALSYNRQPWGQQTRPDTGETLDVWRWRSKAFHDGIPDEQIPKGYWKDSWGPKPGEPGCRAPN
jgi:hypothetical protein